MKQAFCFLQLPMVLLIVCACAAGCIARGKGDGVGSFRPAMVLTGGAADARAVGSPAVQGRPPSVQPSDDSARVRPGLVLNVYVLVAGKKEIEVKGHRVADRGTIAIPLLGTVAVENLTLDEMAKKLNASYMEYFINPQVVVEFERDDNKEGLSPWGSVTVLGRVKQPGKISIPATRDMTLSGAIQQAGGFDTSAKQSAVRITRRLANGKMDSREVNFHSVGDLGRLEDDVRLEPDDVIFVPELVF